MASHQRGRIIRQAQGHEPVRRDWDEEQVGHSGKSWQLNEFSEDGYLFTFRGLLIGLMAIIVAAPTGIVAGALAAAKVSAGAGIVIGVGAGVAAGIAAGLSVAERLNNRMIKLE